MNTLGSITTVLPPVPTGVTVMHIGDLLPSSPQPLLHKPDEPAGPVGSGNGEEGTPTTTTILVPAAAGTEHHQPGGGVGSTGAANTNNAMPNMTPMGAMDMGPVGHVATAALTHLLNASVQLAASGGGGGVSDGSGMLFAGGVPVAPRANAPISTIHKKCPYSSQCYHHHHHHHHHLHVANHQQTGQQQQQQQQQQQTMGSMITANARSTTNATHYRRHHPYAVLQQQQQQQQHHHQQQGSSSRGSAPSSPSSSISSSMMGQRQRDAISANVALPPANASVVADRYLLMEQIEGNNVYRCCDIQSHEELVCKITKNPCFNLLTAHFRLENHPHVNSLRKVVQGHNQTYLFYSPSKGDLHSYVRTRKRLREPEARRLCRQMCAVIKSCHEQGIVLRDLKLRKFVFADSEGTHLKLESLEDAVVLDDPAQDLLQDKRGCPAYVSPELLRTNTSYSGKSADMWSLGVILYTMLVGRYPFNDSEHASLFAKISRGQYTVPECLSSKARCMIRSLLRRDPEERITSDDVLYHPWLLHDDSKDPIHTSSSRAAAAAAAAASAGDDQTVPEWYLPSEDQQQQQQQQQHDHHSAGSSSSRYASGGGASD
uniref:Putative serine/threonine protein kinase n=1 Tax=Anopheles darlingi TaxID=43151 RepID=A0A2M4CGQ3_ANODA